MKEIIKTTRYWLFKKVNFTMPGSDSIYYYVRCKTDGIDRYMWLVGYENSIGLVSPVGGELPGEMAKELESEFQKTKEVRQSKLKTINEKVL